MTPDAIFRGVRAEQAARRYRGEALFSALLEQDARLVAHGFPPLTEWWRAKLRDFYLSGKRRLVPRVGRKGIKSGTMCRVAVNEALRGEHTLRPGDLGLVMFLSENVKEAKNRLFTIKQILEALGEGYDLPEGDVKLRDRPIIFGVRAARIGTVSGPIVICLIGDEVSKWRDEATGSNPATEVLRSVRPAMVTQANAHEFLISSPWSTVDAHHDAFIEGDTAHQMVAHAPTWLANPTVTEEETHALEPDELTWLREYAAVPMGSTEHHFFDHRLIDAAVDRSLELPIRAAPGIAATAGGDLGLVSDSAALVIVHRAGGAWDDDKAIYTVADIVENRPTPEAPLRPGVVVAGFAERLKWHAIDYLMADGHYRHSMQEHLNEAGLFYTSAPTESHLEEPYVRTRVLLAGRRLIIPDHPRLIRQLKEVTVLPSNTGKVRFHSPRKAGGGHGDIVSALVLALWQRSGKAQPHPGPAPGSPEWQVAIMAEKRKQAIREANERERRNAKRGRFGGLQ